VTGAQTRAWNAWRKYDRNAPEQFTPGKYVCPAHGGARRDVSIRYEGRRVRFHCFDGCPLQAVLDRLRLRLVDLDDGPQMVGTPAGTFTYTDERGAEVLRVHRWEKPAGARHERFTPDGWAWDNRAGVRGRLYRLPEVVAAVEAGERVYAVEGERHADALRIAGVVATCAPRKPGATWSTSQLEHLRGAYVTVIARRDEAGAKWARVLSAGLRSIARDVALVEPATNRPGAGAAEHLAAGFGLDDFASLSPVETAATVPPVPADPPAIASEQRILDKFTEAVRKLGVVGERATAATTYLVLTSRLLDQQASLAVKGHSASGKSFTVEQTIRFFLPEAVLVMTAMSQRALVYSTEEYAHRTLVIYEATALREGVEEDLTSYFIRSLLSEGRIAYPVTVRDETGNFTTRTIIKEGPTNLVVTTTKAEIHAENETRALSITTDDSRDQTARVLAALADETEHGVDLDEWIQLQRWLAAAEHRVTIPYAATLAKLVPPVAVRLRRDFGTVLALIRAHAVLHQQSRKRDPASRIIADLDDYEQVRKLVGDIVAEGVAATVSPTIRETVEVVRILTTSQGPGDRPPHPDGVTAQHAAAELGLDRSAAWRRLYAAASAGYVYNAEHRRGKPGRWKPGEPLPVAVAVLPVADDLAAAIESESAGQASAELGGGTVARESTKESGPELRSP
jgi:hypothetical protein